MSTPVVTHNPQALRYEAHLDGERRSLAAVLDAIGAIPVPFSPRELVDLDTPDDVLRYRQSR